jgi:accessory gene regulator B
MEKIAEKMALYIKKNAGPHPTSLAVLKFGIQGFLNFLVTTILLLVFSCILGQDYEVFILAVSFGVLRMLIGGAHLKTGLGCAIGSTFMLVTLSYISLSKEVAYLLLTCSILIVLIFPFYLEPHQSTKALQYKKVFKMFALLWISFGFIGTYFMAGFPSAFALGLFSQAITITPLGVKTIHKINQWL